MDLLCCGYRVSITLTVKDKHELPIEESCPWWHVNGFQPSEHAFPLDEKVSNYADLVSGVEEVGCELTGGTPGEINVIGGSTSVWPQQASPTA